MEEEHHQQWKEVKETEEYVEETEEEEEVEETEEEEEEDPKNISGSNILTRDDIKKELSSMSFDEVIKLQNKVGTKVYNQVAYGRSKKQESSTRKRLNKNRPMEMSSKKPAPFLRQVVAVKKPALRDPRFDDLSGEFKPEIFEKTYGFINHIRQREKNLIHKQLKRKKMSNNKREKLHSLLKRMENQERARKSQEEQREREVQMKRQLLERANHGARPFFYKKSEKKKMQLAEKFNQLKKSGKLENFLSKRRKKNAQKDRRKLPPPQLDAT